MLVTINTDASFHPKLKYGAYAFWAICNDFKITKSGVFKSLCHNSDDAEAKCIINALQVVLSTNNNISSIIFNTDSLNAVSIIEGRKKDLKCYRKWYPSIHVPIRQKYLSIVSAFQKKINAPIKIEFRHVKAHSEIKDARSYVNEWCDSQAKQQLRKKVYY